MKTALLACALVLAACTTPPVEQDGRDASHEVIVLEFADAEELATALSELVEDAGGGDIQILANADTNSLLLSAADEQMAQLKTLIAHLDVEVDEPGAR